MRTPYFHKLADDGEGYELYFHTGDDFALVFTFRQEHLAIAAENLCNDAFHRGRLHELRDAKHRGNLENQRLVELIANLDSM